MNFYLNQTFAQSGTVFKRSYPRGHPTYSWAHKPSYVQTPPPSWTLNLEHQEGYVWEPRWGGDGHQCCWATSDLQTDGVGSGQKGLI